MNPSNNISPQNPLDLSLRERLLRQELQAQEKTAQDPNKLWEKIEAGLEAKTSKKRFPLWIPIGVAASLLAAVVAWQLLDKNALPQAGEPIFVAQKVETSQTDKVMANKMPTNDLPTEEKTPISEKNRVAGATLSETKASFEAEVSANSTSKNESMTSISVQNKKQTTKIASLVQDSPTKEVAPAKEALRIEKDALVQQVENPNMLLAQNNSLQESSPWTQGKKEEGSESGKKMYITIKFGQTEEPALAQSEGSETPTELSRAKAILREAWNLKAGKKVEWRNVLPESGQTKSY
ncbi:hypothetical protein [Hugenholtzia roseola]|uniref:hypothetical protein n=1 Tax=Hugenholtzia roseola TaxID=1002 RepID=UPI000400C3D0|nr:hypothetical protein [Hugenholtzia roseola]